MHGDIERIPPGWSPSSHPYSQPYQPKRGSLKVDQCPFQIRASEKAKAKHRGMACWISWFLLKVSARLATRYGQNTKTRNLVKAIDVLDSQCPTGIEVKKLKDELFRVFPTKKIGTTDDRSESRSRALVEHETEMDWALIAIDY